MAKFRISKKIKNGVVSYTIKKYPFLRKVGKFDSIMDCINYIYENYDISKCVIKYDKIW